jgi:hypothetical protein
MTADALDEMERAFGRLLVVEPVEGVAASRGWETRRGAGVIRCPSAVRR